MKEQVLKWWNEFLNGAITEYGVNREKVLKILLVVVLLGLSFFLIGQCARTMASDKPPEKPPEVRTETRVECDRDCKRRSFLKGVGVGALGVTGIWYFNQKGAEKKKPEISFKTRQE